MSGCLSRPERSEPCTGFFVSPDQIGEREITIEGSDVNHIVHVLRMKPGEELRLCTGQDEKDYRCRISRITEEQVTAEILWVEESGVELPSRLYHFQGTSQKRQDGADYPESGGAGGL